MELMVVTALLILLSIALHNTRFQPVISSGQIRGAVVTPTLTPQPVSGAGAARTSTHAQATPDSKDDLAVLLNTDSSSVIPTSEGTSDLADAITSCYDSSKKSFWESLNSQASEIKAISKLEEVLRDKVIPQNWRVKQPKLKIKDPNVQKELNELAGFKHTEYQLTLLSLLLDARKKELVIFSGQVKNACRTFDDHLLDIVLTALQDISNPSSRSLLQRELAAMVYAKRDLFAKDVIFAQANRRLQEQNRQNAEDARLAAQDKAKLLS
ncbi:hypothetical protein SELMODRAFT_410205 [Selaginella moellendorffii]|uniref:Uncharacterized protein n=1 Tax=Selaginella moellendorffii TaxID=88036 RepID=D8RDZ5_SELML|nr:hypothetical protein SELMODRAFT_410205 [Selaginella moellendorffii]